MVTLTTKLYLQFAPDNAGLEYLQKTQQLLFDAQRLVKSSELHLTILHIGLLSKLYLAVKQESYVSEGEFLMLVEAFLEKLSAIVANSKYDQLNLTPYRFDRFGDSGSTYVMVFHKTDEVIELHAQSLEILKQMLRSAGVTDVAAFMLQDHNLRYALTVKPHVTLARSYAESDIRSPFKQVNFYRMPTIY